MEPGHPLYQSNLTPLGYCSPPRLLRNEEAIGAPRAPRLVVRAACAARLVCNPRPPSRRTGAVPIAVHAQPAATAAPRTQSIHPRGVCTADCVALQRPEPGGCGRLLLRRSRHAAQHVGRLGGAAASYPGTWGASLRAWAALSTAGERLSRSDPGSSSWCRRQACANVLSLHHSTPGCRPR